MAMTNAERQAAWRSRQAKKLENVEAEVERRVKQALRNDRAAPRSRSNKAPDFEIEDLWIARAETKQLKTILATVTRLDPGGAVEALRNELDELEHQSKVHFAKFMATVVPKAVVAFRRYFSAWRELGIKGVDELAARCEPLLKALLAMSKRNRWSDDDRAKLGELAAELRREIEGWRRLTAGPSDPARRPAAQSGAAR